MNWYNFIFSEKSVHRLRRHLVFWLLWAIYFSVSFFHYQQTGVEKVEFEIWSLPFFIKVILLLLIHISACYFFIAYLIPNYLFQSKYATLILSSLALGFLILITSYFTHKAIFPLIDSAFNHKSAIESQNIWWTSITSGLLSAPKVICAAAAVKLLKRWYLKQKEKERLEKEKAITDLELLKAQMHPEFLFSSLNNIYLLAKRNDNAKASALLLKLADILSYILYESNNEYITVEKEINIIKSYLLLEKARMNDHLELDVAVKGHLNDKTITPLLLFSLIENSFLYISNKKPETNWMNVEFNIESYELTMKLIYGKSSDTLITADNESMVNNVTKRLDYFYPGNYELKTTAEPEIMMICLKIMLEKPVTKKENSIYNTEQIAYATI